MEQTLLSVQKLTVDLTVGKEKVRVLHGVSFDVCPGEIIGLVGESGSGKSVTASAVMQLLPGGAGAVSGGKIIFNGQDLLKKSPEEMQGIRGKDISMIFQEPMTSLNPVLTIGRQFIDVIRAHQSRDQKEATLRACEMLKAVHITDPERIFKSYPYELSGGMRQRVMIAIALSCSPSLLIADEPTTALDVTIQAQILRLLREATQVSGSAVIFISHDLGVVSQICRRVAVMYAGEIVEYGLVQEILQYPRHPYTQALLKAIPDFTTKPHQLSAIPGTVPNIRQLLTGCRFHPRCPVKQDICMQKSPQGCILTGNHLVRCWVTTGEVRNNAAITNA
ncbi:putative peptide ABC transporter ATP-binding protein y4tR [Propionispora sp. 2/2-37]|uniref:ABC transporter ATP-binding protein n=1 Tax=Propionispora sp. 2/2-37 TaxID=1677858 RepID=UPI0006BB69B8|nr:ABC transporter ATP-binding protein [Propionispora sp. 2/2-37]CUH95810.1 putative peptide ABC transporter ATP-binding protein y4tR [Propionispora sp. 2/2-37]